MDAGQVNIHLVAESGLAKSVTPDFIMAALEKEPLPVDAAVTPGSWLVAKPNTPAASRDLSADISDLSRQFKAVSIQRVSSVRVVRWDETQDDDDEI